MVDKKLTTFTDHVPPLKASDLAHLVSGEVVEPVRLVHILSEAAKSVAGTPSQHDWDTEEEQHTFNVIRAVINNSMKVVKGK